MAKPGKEHSVVLIFPSHLRARLSDTRDQWLLYFRSRGNKTSERVQCAEAEDLPRFEKSVHEERRPVKSLEQCMHVFFSKFERIMTASSAYTQLDMLSDVIKELHEIPNTPQWDAVRDLNYMRIFVDTLAEALVTIAVEQLYNSRLRKHVTQKLLLLDNSEARQDCCRSFGSAGLNEILKRRVDQTFNIVSTFLNSETVVSEKGSLLCETTQQVSVILEDQHLYGRFFSFSINPPNFATYEKLTLAFFSKTLSQEVIARNREGSQVEKARTEEPQPKITDAHLSVLVKTVSLFVSLLVPETLEKHCSWFLQQRNVLPLWKNLFQALLQLLALSSTPREIVTMGGQLVATLVLHEAPMCSMARCSVLIKQQNSTVLDTFEVSGQFEQWWSSASPIGRMSVIRGVVAQIGSLPVLNVSDVTMLYNFLVNHIQPEHVVETLYGLQGILVWLTCSSRWKARFGFDAVKNRIHDVLALAMRYWESSFKPLGPLCYKIWDTILDYCEHSATLAERVCREICAGNIGKFQCLALEAFASRRGLPWILSQQPLVVEYVLTATASRSRRSAALQLLLFFLKENTMCASTSLINNMSLHHRLNLVAQALCGKGVSSPSLPERRETEEHKTLQPIILDAVGRLKLQAALVDCLIPAVGKKCPTLLTELWHHVLTLRHREHRATDSPSLKHWYAPEAALLAAAREAGYGCWRFIKHIGEYCLVVSSEKSLPTEVVLSEKMMVVPSSVWKCGVIQRDDAIRLHVIAAVCHGNETLQPPCDTEWDLVESIILTSLNGQSLEARSRVVTSVHKFLRRGIESLLRNIHRKNYESLQKPLQYLRGIHSKLLRCVDPTIPFETSGPCLDVLVHFYRLLSPIENHIKYSYFSFMFLDNVWNTLWPAGISSWDRQRLMVTEVLLQFPPQNVRLWLPKTIPTLTPLMLGIKQAEYMGSAELFATVVGIVFRPDVNASVVDESNSEKNDDFMFCSAAVHSQTNSNQGDSNVTPSKQDVFAVHSEPEEELHHLLVRLLLSNLKSVKHEPAFPSDALLFRVTDGIERSKASHIRVTYGYIQVIRLLLDFLFEHITESNKIESYGTVLSVHGLFCCIVHCLKRMPISCACFLQHFEQCLKERSLTGGAELEQRLRRKIRKILTDLIMRLTAVQWKSTVSVLKILFQGVDCVLLTPELEMFCLKNERFSRVKGVDCRGHPIIVPSLTKESVLDENIELEEDAALLRSWVTVKEGAETLEHLFHWIDLDQLIQWSSETLSELTPQFFNSTCHGLLTLLLGIKHPAVMDRLGRAVSSLSRCMALTHYPAYRRLPTQWIHMLVQLVCRSVPEKCSGYAVTVEEFKTEDVLPLPPPLRRSFSLGHSFLAILTSDPSRYQTMNLLPSALKPLLGFLDHSRVTCAAADLPDDCDEHGSIVHCLNICRFIVRCGALTTASTEHLGHILHLAIRYSSHQRWTVRNASNLLFAATTERLTGNRWEVSGEELLGVNYTAQAESTSLHGNVSDPKGFFLSTGSRRRQRHVSTVYIASWRNALEAANVREERIDCLDVCCTSIPDRNVCTLQMEKARFLVDLLGSYPPLGDSIRKILDTSFLQSQKPDPIHESVAVNTLFFLSRLRLDGCSDIVDILRCWRTQARCYQARVLAAWALTFSPKVQLQSDKDGERFLTEVLDALEPDNVGVVNNNTLHGALTNVLEYVSRSNVAGKPSASAIASATPTKPSAFCPVAAISPAFLTLFDITISSFEKTPSRIAALNYAILLQIIEQMIVYCNKNGEIPEQLRLLACRASRLCYKPPARNSDCNLELTDSGKHHDCCRNLNLRVVDVPGQSVVLFATIIRLSLTTEPLGDAFSFLSTLLIPPICENFSKTSSFPIPFQVPCYPILAEVLRVGLIRLKREISLVRQNKAVTPLPIIISLRVLQKKLKDQLSHLQRSAGWDAFRKVDGAEEDETSVNRTMDFCRAGCSAQCKASQFTVSAIESLYILTLKLFLRTYDLHLTLIENSSSLQLTPSSESYNVTEEDTKDFGKVLCQAFPLQCKHKQRSYFGFAASLKGKEKAATLLAYSLQLHKRFGAAVRAQQMEEHIRQYLSDALAHFIEINIMLKAPVSSRRASLKALEILTPDYFLQMLEHLTGKDAQTMVCQLEYVAWISLAFLLTDASSEIGMLAASLASKILLSDQVLQYLCIKWRCLAETVQKLYTSTVELLPNVCLFFLLRVTIAVFYNKRPVDIYIRHFQNEAMYPVEIPTTSTNVSLPQTVEAMSVCFDEEPLNYSQDCFLRLVYDAYCDATGVCCEVYEPLNVTAVNTMHSSVADRLDSAAQWVSSLQNPFDFYTVPRYTSAIHALLIEARVMSHLITFQVESEFLKNIQDKESRLRLLCIEAKNRGIFLPPQIFSLCTLPSAAPLSTAQVGQSISPHNSDTVLLL